MRGITFIIALVFLSLLSAVSEARALHLVTSLDPLEAKEYISAFENETGVKVEWVRLSSGEIAARMKAEGTRPSQSVWFGAPLPEFAAAKEGRYLEAYKPKNFDSVPPKFRDPDGFWTGIYFGYIAFVTNKDFLRKNNLQPPTSWLDLLSPVYKGYITVSYPYTAGTGFTVFAGLVALMGEDQAIEYWKKLDKSIHHYTKTGSTPVVEVGLGEAALGMAFSQDVMKKGIMRKFPVEMSFAKEGVPFEVGCVGIFKGAPERDLAEKFVDWAVSLPAQNMMYRWERLPILPTAKVGDGLKFLKGVKLIDMDLVEYGKKRSELIDHWRRELKQ